MTYIFLSIFLQCFLDTNVLFFDVKNVLCDMIFLMNLFQKFVKYTHGKVFVKHNDLFI